MIVYWKTREYDTHIEPCQFDHETAQCLVDLCGRREFKVTERDHYYPTWEAARYALLDREQRNLRQLETNLAICRERIETLIRATEPDGGVAKAEGKA